MDEFPIFRMDAQAEGQRIDKYLALMLKDEFSRAELKRLIDSGKVLLNDHPVKPHQKIKAGDTVRIADRTVKIERDIPAAKIPLNIIFEDEYVILLNKPAGIVVHPAAGHFDDTLVNALLYHTQSLSDVGGPQKMGIVHRLDKDTSGVMVVAKDNKSHRCLASQFKKHTVKKIYLALVCGKVEYDEGIIDAPICRSSFDRKKMSVSGACARDAITKYRVLKREKGFSVVEAYPQTGRTHQIRVHMAHLGHPLLGDLTYNRTNTQNAMKRQALHARLLGFNHPQSGKYVEFEAPVPEDMLRLINSGQLCPSE